MGIIPFLFVLGVIVESMSGALAAGRARLDIFGVIMIATITGLGGGTLRDILIGSYPLIWVRHPSLLLLTSFAAMLPIIGAVYMAKYNRLFLILDALGLAVFSILGTQKGINLGLPFLVNVVLAIVTGISGGMLRDILCNDVPLVLRRELYAIIAIIASCCYQGLNYLGIETFFDEIITLILGFTLRLWAIFYKVELPKFNYPPNPP
jgi:uncharacterized membrane protein YeiH